MKTYIAPTLAPKGNAVELTKYFPALLGDDPSGIPGDRERNTGSVGFSL
jgi:hypothetical protein